SRDVDAAWTVPSSFVQLHTECFPPNQSTLDAPLLTPFLWSQLFAAAAFACGLASFQFRERRTFLLLLISLALLNSCHFFLLDRPAPGCMLMLTAMRYLTAMFTQRRAVLLVYIVIAIAACILTYNGPLSLLALLAVVLGTCGSFQRSDRIMRLCFLGGNSTWL